MANNLTGLLPACFRVHRRPGLFLAVSLCTGLALAAELRQVRTPSFHSTDAAGAWMYCLRALQPGKENARGQIWPTVARRIFYLRSN